MTKKSRLASYLERELKEDEPDIFRPTDAYIRNYPYHPSQTGASLETLMAASAIAVGYAALACFGPAVIRAVEECVYTPLKKIFAKTDEKMPEFASLAVAPPDKVESL